MSNITLGDIANDAELDTIPVEHEQYYEEQEKVSRMNDTFNKVLTAETGEGSIGDYIEHPLNFSNSKGLAQVIRGITGIFGNLNLAIVDIVFGLLRFSKERKTENVITGLPRGSSINP